MARRNGQVSSCGTLPLAVPHRRSTLPPPGKNAGGSKPERDSRCSQPTDRRSVGRTGPQSSLRSSVAPSRRRSFIISPPLPARLPGSHRPPGSSAEARKLTGHARKFWHGTRLCVSHLSPGLRKSSGRTTRPWGRVHSGSRAGRDQWQFSWRHPSYRPQLLCSRLRRLRSTSALEESP